MVKKKIACLIPVRSNSKRIRNKNIKKINNEPLIKYVCKNIFKSKLIDDYYIASDDYKIYNKIGNLKKKFNFFKRSQKSALDISSTEIVIKEFLKSKNDINILILVQITNPFINSKHIDAAIKKFKKNNFSSLLSVVASKNFLWENKKFSKPINYNHKKRPRTQNFKNYYVENGSFYIFYKKNFFKHNNRLHGKIGTYEMPIESYFEIDNKFELKKIRKILKK